MNVNVTGHFKLFRSCQSPNLQKSGILPQVEVIVWNTQATDEVFIHFQMVMFCDVPLTKFACLLDCVF